MGRRGNRQNSPRLLRLAEQFAAWRAKRSVGTRIPNRLWVAAEKAATCNGVNQTAKVLRIDYYALKKRVAGNGSHPVATRTAVSMPTFVELPTATLAASGECVIEFEKPEGAKLRIHLKGAQVPDLLALGAAFWSTE